jgi:hypothetical protein
MLKNSLILLKNVFKAKEFSKKWLISNATPPPDLDSLPRMYIDQYQDYLFRDCNICEIYQIHYLILDICYNYLYYKRNFVNALETPKTALNQLDTIMQAKRLCAHQIIKTNKLDQIRSKLCDGLETKIEDFLKQVGKT